jgi:hypothetical protein
MPFGRGHWAKVIKQGYSEEMKYRQPKQGIKVMCSSGNRRKCHLLLPTFATVACACSSLSLLGVNLGSRHDDLLGLLIDAGRCR